MKRAAIVALSLALVGAAVALAGPLQDEVITPYVEVLADDCMGSGSVIDVCGEKLVLTAAHVVEGNYASETKTYVDLFGYRLTHTAKRKKPFTLVKRDKGLERKWTADLVWCGDSEQGPDLALLKPRNPEGLVAAQLDTSAALEAGEDCWYCGSGGGIHRNLVKSIICRTDYEREDGRRFLLVNGEGYYGHSGSNIFVKRDGHFVTVGTLVVFTVRTGDGYRLPMGCENQSAIRKFIRAYKEAK